MDRVVVDTNILCAAILTPGLSRKLLQLGRSGLIYEPVIGEVVVCEFIEHCRKGMRGRTFSEEEIDDFFRMVAPMLDFENIKRIRIGKELWIDVTRLKMPVQQCLYDMFYTDLGVRKSELLLELEQYGKNLEDVDLGDLHVMYSALQYDCNVIVTTNTDDFPKVLGEIEVFKPGYYYDLVTKNLR